MPEFQVLLKEWGTWVDPPGFGSEKDVMNPEEEDVVIPEDASPNPEQRDLEEDVADGRENDENGDNMNGEHGESDDHGPE